MHQQEKMLGHLADSRQQVVARKNKGEISPEMEDLLAEALPKIDAEGKRFIREVVVFNRIIGNTNCVKTTSADDDAILYARRPYNDGETRFVKNRDPEPSNKLYIVLKRSNDKFNYVLIKAAIGEAREPEMWDEVYFEIDSTARGRSNEFWSSHAIVWGSEEVLPESVVVIN